MQKSGNKLFEMGELVKSVELVESVFSLVTKLHFVMPLKVK